MMREAFSESEVNLITQGLDLLLTVKREAHRWADESYRFGGSEIAYTESDFGIPQIIALQGKIDGVSASDEPESEVSA
ncbi:hypothetical protein [uncultured Thiobacillus sp.]|uniref:hypothetical protein n=1 Tax=uncultured Thiobacillus sp. TaxID=189996 RepID=UPI00095E6274|nr:hypothetical protein [uncultured Thiobacillus sp.]OJY56634.1 MAG: hypothetical protein BGP19_04610 [Thiobacillus sp. 0-1251]